MPLIIEDENVKWTELSDKMHISVPLPERYTKNASVLCASEYLQVSSPPYIWECFLPSLINSECSVARIGDGCVTFQLQKQVKKTWGRLKHWNSGDKSFCKVQRQKALQEMENVTKMKAERKAKEKYEKSREAIRKQMQIDEMESKRIENEKLAAKKRMDEELKRLRKEKARRSSLENSTKANMKEKVKVPVPPPRAYGEIAVNFTPRVFPTAARESQAEEESQWLESQKAASKSLEFDSSDLRPEERNPTWLESKGDSLREKGDYLAAVNAYTLVLRMCPNKSSVYTSRASCHLHLRNLHKAIEDSSKALELLHPSSASDSRNRIKNHICRGKAFCQLELYVEGLMDFEAALKMNPENSSLKQEADAVRMLISQSPE